LRVTAANAGDARIVLGRTIDETVKPLRLTHDHNTHDENEVHRIEQAGGFVLKQRVMGILAITRSLGDHQLKPYVIATPYMQDVTISLEDDPFLIVACDGFWDVCTDQQAVDLVRFYQNDPSFHNGKTVADFLVDEALRRGTSDNVTVIVAFFRAREQS
jgi:serine/threonine protein phosphatase PrpC